MPYELMLPRLVLLATRLTGVVLVGAGGLLALRHRRSLIALLFHVKVLPPDREDTLGPILISVTRWLIWAISLLTVLTLCGADVLQVLTGAGLVGLALAMGAQNVVRDIIAGIFIMVEDQYRPGDYVKLNGETEGIVESLDLRMTRLRGWDGAVVSIGNASVTRVKNYNRDQMRVIIEAAVPFEEDHAKVRAVIQEVCTELARTHREHLIQENGLLVEPPFLYGVVDINSAKGVGATYCIMALTQVNSYWFVAREIRRLLLERFRQNGIRFSYPQRIFHQP